MENTQNADRFRYTRRPDPLSYFGGKCFVFAAIVTPLFVIAAPSATLAWQLTPVAAVMLVLGLMSMTMRSRVCIPAVRDELIVGICMFGLALEEKRMKAEFNSVVVERDWDVNQPESSVQYIVKLVGPRTIFYVDEVPYLSQADKLAEDLAKASNLSIMKEGYFPARFK